jgi:hypothetical protein
VAIQVFISTSFDIEWRGSTKVFRLDMRIIRLFSTTLQALKQALSSVYRSGRNNDCVGYANRLLGIASAFLIALLTDRGSLSAFPFPLCLSPAHFTHRIFLASSALPLPCNFYLAFAPTPLPSPTSRCFLANSTPVAYSSSRTIALRPFS